MAIERLKRRFIETMKEGMHSDGNGLYLQVGKGSARSWIFRYRMDGKDWHMGLGPTRDVEIDEAREAARDCRRQIRAGVNPLKAREADRLAKILEAAKNVTFSVCAKEYRDLKARTWAPSTAEQAESVIRMYLNPAFGNVPVSMIDHLQIERMLKPIWESKPPTGLLVRMHLEAILDLAKAKGYRTGDNPASLKGGQLKFLLPDTKDFHVVQHHRYLPFSEIGAFMARVKAYRADNQPGGTSMGAWLLQFIILTAVRTQEAQFMQWDEIDWDKKLWNCPWQRTKTGKKTKRPHVIPLSEDAIKILRTMQAFQKADDNSSKYVFTHRWPSDAKQHRLRIGRGGRHQAGKPLGSLAASAFMKRSLGRRDITVHGFRRTFKTWAVENRYDEILSEIALDHVIGGAVRNIYGGDATLIEPRRQMMDAWAEYCGRTEPLSADVIPIRQAK